MILDSISVNSIWEMKELRFTGRYPSKFIWLLTSTSCLQCPFTFHRTCCLCNAKFLSSSSKTFTRWNLWTSAVNYITRHLYCHQISPLNGYPTFFLVTNSILLENSLWDWYFVLIFFFWSRGLSVLLGIRPDYISLFSVSNKKIWMFTTDTFIRYWKKWTSQ